MLQRYVMRLELKDPYERVLSRKMCMALECALIMDNLQMLMPIDCGQNWAETGTVSTMKRNGVRDRRNMHPKEQGV